MKGAVREAAIRVAAGIATGVEYGCPFLDVADFERQLLAHGFVVAPKEPNEMMVEAAASQLWEVSKEFRRPMASRAYLAMLASLGDGE